MRLLLLKLAALAAVSQVASAENELIFAKILNGKTIPIEFEPSDKVERLKDKIEQKEGISQALQQLIYSDQLLEEGRQLSEYGLVAGSSVTLLVNHRDDSTQRILVENPIKDKTLSYQFLPNMTVADFKSETLGIRPYESDRFVCGYMQLFHGNRLLGDNQKLLSDYNVGAWSTLTAAYRYGDTFSKIIVEIPSLKRITLDVETNDTVGSIKDKISAMEGIPRDQQRLIFGDKQRENVNDTLDDLDTDSWPLVTLELRPGQGPKQQVFVKILNSKIMYVKVEVDLNDKVSSLKAAIESKTHVPAHLQQLVYRGKLLLDDDKHIKVDYDIAAWSTLTLIVRPREHPSERVIVKTLTNRSITINIDPRDTVAILKDKIRQKTQVQQYVQQLIFDSKLLEYDQQLSYYGIKNKSTDFMVLYLEGAEPW